MVRLIVEEEMTIENEALFQFLHGTIDSASIRLLPDALTSFNSFMVRLIVLCAVQSNAVHDVSIPSWYD